MEDVSSFTDAELRTKLIEFGFPVMPITGTTRKVMAKKLKLLMENKDNKTNDRRSLAQFSSEEESDSDVKPGKKDKTRRATMAVPPMQPPSTNKVTVRKTTTRRIESEVNDIKEPIIVSSREETSKSSGRTTKIMDMAEKDLDSDSEPENVDTNYASQSRNHYEKRESPVKSVSSSYKYSSKYSPPTSTDAITSRTSYLSHSPSRFSSTPVDAAEKLNQIRSRLSLGASNYDSYSSAVDNDSTETPFLSNFTQRLSQLSTNKDFNLKTDVIKEHDSNGAGAYNKTYLSRAKPREYARDYQSSQETKASKGTNVSFILVGCVALFFIVLTALYWGLHSGNNTSEILGVDIPYCQKRDENAKIRENCVTEDDAEGVIDIYKIIKPELVKRAVDNVCADSKLTPYMTEQDIVTYIQDTYNLPEDFTILLDLHNFIIVLYRNLFWDVSVLQSQSTEFTDSDKINSLEQVLENKRNNFTTAFAVLEPTLPLKCSLYIKFMFLLKTLTIAAVLAAVGMLAKRGYKQYKYHEQRKNDEIVLMVERIIEILHLNMSKDSDNILVVNHVRDMILPIENRKKMEKTWEKAVKFINEHESRVRTEVQIIQGEPYNVWRWLGGISTSPARNKSWQGQAFETQVGSVNSPPYSPTPCLKIRGMVEDGDRNLHTIREAVLVKCADQCRILHCKVDVNSKCVYLKCADKGDAAVAYVNLHGWWYAKHLVTVKYIRLERYMQRFPDSPASGPPFLKANSPL